MPPQLILPHLPLNSLLSSTSMFLYEIAKNIKNHLNFREKTINLNVVTDKYFLKNIY